MDLNQDRVYSDVQSIFCQGLVIVVGSGASCAMGLPGMTELANHLQTTIPDEIIHRGLSCEPEWKPVSDSLRQGNDLETALGPGITSDDLSELIAAKIAECIYEKEIDAIANILDADASPAFSRLFEYALRITECLDVITTNYDRLLEAQAARSGIALDSMFYGDTIGKLDADLSKKAMRRPEKQVGKPNTVLIRNIPHIRLSKPHGSLDWFAYNHEYYRSDLAIPGARRIVAPGGNKYRRGYDQPFDQQRERANSAIDNADALMFIGYGFNDEHLQTHIKEQMKKIPSIIISRSLTDKARQYISDNTLALALQASDSNRSHTHALKAKSEIVIDKPIWNLDDLIKEVLGQ